MSYKNKVVLVTGGSVGIGASIAVLFAKEGANVVIVGRNEINLKKVAETCEQYGNEALIIKADLTKDEEVKTILEQTIKKFGKLDVLINNAGIIKSGELLNGSALDAYDDVFKVNLRAVVHITSLAAPYLVKTKGNIVNISGALGTRPLLKIQDLTAYSMSKAALNYFTRGAALELSAHGVRVNSISPGATRTDIFETGGIPTDWSMFEQAAALKKASHPEEVAELVLYIASDKAKSVTGAEYLIDNGILLTA